MHNNKIKNILVISHRRSGTHLTIDLIRNNFAGYEQPPMSLNESSVRDIYFIKQYIKTQKVYKSHSDINFNKFHTEQYIRGLFKRLLQSSHLIYVSRETKDVLTSLYFFYQKCYPQLQCATIDDFIVSNNEYHSWSYEGDMNRIVYAKYHHERWAGSEYANRILFLSYEELLNNYYDTVEKISSFINLPPSPKIKDIRLSSDDNLMINKVQGNISRTSEHFRSGKIGDYKNHLSPASIKLIDETL